MVLTIGVDVGGTNTDAVILGQSEVICTAKTPTTDDITSGLECSISKAITNLPSCFNIDQIQRVNIGTTHFVNALVQRRDIVRVAVIRLCGPSSQSVPPFSDFPDDLRAVIAGPYYFLNGGYEYDGKETITEIVDEEIKTAIKEIVETGIRNIVVAGVFSLVNSKQEKHVQEIINELYPSVSVTLSHDVGLLGFLERENASILNECLKPLCDWTVRAFHEALQRLGLPCPFYLTQNDGTVISATRAVRFPVFTLSSGPTNSMRGAAYLSQLQDTIVIDIGGTTSDVGVLCKGFPRQSSTRVKVAGVNTNFRMPDVLSFGLGGGSLVVKEQNLIKVGPQSVGYRLEQDSLVFGGKTMTASDIAVASSLCDIGDEKKVAHIPEDMKTAALCTIKRMIENAIDHVKISKKDQPVVLVGGGSVLVDSNWKLDGVSKFIKPKHFQAANAVGAALSKVSGIVDKVFSLGNKTEAEVMEEAVIEALQEAERNGAKRESIEIVEKVSVKLAYLPGNVTRIQIKAVGDLAECFEDSKVPFKVKEITSSSTADKYNKQDTQNHTKAKELEMLLNKEGDKTVKQSKTHEELRPSLSIKQTQRDQSTKPYIDPSTGEWVLSEFDIECMAIGAGILGCGGGGNPYIGKIRIQQLIRSGKEIRVVHPGTLSETDHVVSVAFMGAPVILIEKLPSGIETCEAAKVLGHLVDNEQCKTDTLPFTAIACAEVGGMNSLEPLAVAAGLGIPVVDADGMGRAFPELQMFLPFVYGCKPFPAAIADDKGNVLAMAKVTSSKELENYFRTICVQMGCSAAIAFSLSGKDVHDYHVHFTLSRIWRLGNDILNARHNKASPIEAILRHESGKLLFTGKISSVERKTDAGFVKGTISIESSTQNDSLPLKIEFQNENYLAYNINDDGSKIIKACVPDLISLVDSDTGEPIPTEEVRYGLRVAVLVMSCSEKWTTPIALSIGGPGAFGFSDVQYNPVGAYISSLPLPKLTKELL